MTRTRIIASLSAGQRLSAAEIAQECAIPPKEAQTLLHDMDDAGEVLLRCGLYRLSQAAKAKMGAQ